MTERGLSEKNLLSTFPIALREDGSWWALAQVIAHALAKRSEEAERARIYPAIDTLPEQVLDILARDFKVEWWSDSYTVEEKRRTLKGAWAVYRQMGTKAAVETAIRAIYPKTSVEEWFDYGGEPYHFRINLDFSGEIWNEERPKKILERTEYYKSLRSHLDSLDFEIKPQTEAEGVLRVGGRGVIHTRIRVPEGGKDK